MRVRLLGPVDLVDDDGMPVSVGGPKERLVLAVLAVHAGSAVSEERLIDALWGEAPPRTSTKTLQSYISRLRKVLAVGTGISIESAPGGYVLHCEVEAIDEGRMQLLLTEARAAAGEGDPDRAAVLLSEAEGLWHGPVLGDLAGEPFAVAEAARLEELRTVVTEERVDAELTCGRHGAIVAELESLTARYPLRERLWAAQMVALYRCGRQADALRTYQELRQRLAEELGIEPTADLVALERSILLQDPELDASPLPAADSAAGVDGPLLPSGVVTFLLTDVEGSSRLWEESFRSMDDAMAAHDAMFESVVDANGGVLLKTRGEGDSTFSVFWRASHAAAAALEAQAALSKLRPAVDLRARMAIHMGEAVERGGDYYGPTVNRAARLRSVANGGEILVSRSAADILSDHPGEDWRLVELGERHLKDLGRPERVWKLLPPGDAPPWVRADGVAARGSLPAPLSRHERFVARETELESLEALFRVTKEGTVRTVLLSGEPGIGKTVVAGEFACRAHAEGALVLYGRCDDGLGAPYQPFAEVAQTIVAANLVDLHSVTGAGELFRLVPDLLSTVPGLAPPVRSDAEAERWFLFEAVTSLFAAVSAHRPVVLIVDDLHWAATPTLLLLRHVMSRESDAQLFVVGTYRDTDLDRSHPFAAWLADLRRNAEVERVSLRGFDEKDVGALVEATAGHELDERGMDLAVAIQRETAGNPFFCTEILRHLAESGAIYSANGQWTSDQTVEQLDLPEGVREVIGRRLSRLSPLANTALAAAAVVGPTFSLRVLETVLGDDSADLVSALDEAVRAALLREEPGEYEFAHALIRQTLLAELGATQTMRLHRRTGEALEALGLEHERVEAAAHHFLESATDGPAEKAARYAAKAADHARQRVAYEEAAQWCTRGLAALELAAQAPPDVAAQLWSQLAHAQAESDRGEARGVILRAAEAARAADDVDGLVDVIMLVMSVSYYGAVDEDLLRLVRGALGMVGTDRPAQRAQLLAVESTIALNNVGDHVRSLEAAEEAAALSEHLEDTTIRGLALHALLTATYGSRRRERLPWAKELYALPPARLHFLDGTRLLHLGSVLLEAGDRDGFDRLAVEMAEIAGRSRAYLTRYYDLLWQGGQARLEAQWDRAQEMAAAIVAMASDDPELTLAGFACHWLVERERGGAGRLAPMLADASEANPGIPVLSALHGSALLDSGRLDDARELLRAWSDDDFSSVRVDGFRPIALGLFAEMAATARDHDAASTLIELLEPRRGTLLETFGGFHIGAADRFLAMLCATSGEYDDAELLFRSALEFEDGLRSPPMMTRTRLWLGRMLLARGDERRAQAELQSVIDGADALGMNGIADEARSMLD